MKRLLILLIMSILILVAGCSSFDNYSAAGSISLDPAITNVPSDVVITEIPAHAGVDFDEKNDDTNYLILVNLDHPIYKEPPVVLICDYLTASDVFCDVRRHANKTAVRALNNMMLAAEKDGDFHFVIASGFRYIYEQEQLWNERQKKEPGYGNDPYNNPIKVMPTNCSEHITGLAFDILCRDCPHSDISFAELPEGQWLAENAHKYGFILRYPKDKQHITGVQYEPWHFRYVGKDAAEYIYNHSLCLEEYLGKLPKQSN